MTDEADIALDVARVRVMALSSLLSDYQDGNLRGWPREVALVWRHNPVAMTALCDDIAANGMRKPVHLGEDGRIWDGHHRIAAALALDLDTIPVTDDWEEAALEPRGASSVPAGQPRATSGGHETGGVITARLLIGDREGVELLLPRRDPECPCAACDPGMLQRYPSRMNVCPDCGNKRCPKAANHAVWQCSGSNEPGQVGARAAEVPSSGHGGGA